MYNANSYNRISFFYVRINIIDRYNLLCIIYSQILTGAWGMDFVYDYEHFDKGMIYMKIWKKRRGSREKGGGGNEIHAPCACE
jgi:hypothetical protein